MTETPLFYISVHKEKVEFQEHSSKTYQSSFIIMKRPVLRKILPEINHSNFFATYWTVGQNNFTRKEIY